MSLLLNALLLFNTLLLCCPARLLGLILLPLALNLILTMALPPPLPKEWQIDFSLRTHVDWLVAVAQSIVLR